MTTTCHCGRVLYVPQTALLYPSMSDYLTFRAWTCRHRAIKPPRPFWHGWRALGGRG